MIKIKSMGIKSSLWLTTLFFGLIALILALETLSALNLGSRALGNIYERSVVPASHLLEINKKLEALRFDMAAVMFDKVPFSDAAARVGDTKASLPLLWGKFKEAQNGQFGHDEQALVAAVDGQIGALEQFYKLLEVAYASSDKVMTRSILDDDWPPVEEKLLNPVLKLVKLQEEKVKATYLENVSASDAMRRWVFATLIIGTLAGIVATIVTSMLARSMVLGIGKLKEALIRVSNGELDARVDYQHQNELGETARHLEKTLDSLRNMIAEVGTYAHTVAEEAENLARLSAGVEENSRVQADAAENTAAVVEEMLTSIEQVADNASQSLEVSLQGNQLCGDGRKVAQDASREMEEIAVAVSHSAELIADLSRKSGEINQIVLLIKDVAGNTNLLALNAAIEAARAGEQGRGFAVVADEVRKLAERTTQATSEIETMISGIQHGTHQAVTSMNHGNQRIDKGVSFVAQTSDSLETIHGGTDRTVRSISEIADATREQKSASQGIARNVEQIVELADENKAAIDRLADSIRNLKTLASLQHQAVAQFRV